MKPNFEAHVGFPKSILEEVNLGGNKIMLMNCQNVIVISRIVGARLKR